MYVQIDLCLPQSWDSLYFRLHRIKKSTTPLHNCVSLWMWTLSKFIFSVRYSHETQPKFLSKFLEPLSTKSQKSEKYSGTSGWGILIGKLQSTAGTNRKFISFSPLRIFFFLDCLRIKWIFSMKYTKILIWTIVFQI